MTRPGRSSKILSVNKANPSRKKVRASTPGRVRRSKSAKAPAEGERYHFLFHKASDAMFLADARTRKLADVNLAAIRLTGFSRAILLTMKADQLHPESVRAATIRGFKRHAAGSSEEVESLVLTAKGREVPVGIRTSLVTIDGRPHLLGIFRDVTGQRKKEQRLSGSEARSRILSSAAQSLLRQADPLKRYNYLLDHAREITRSQYGFIGYMDPDTGYLVAPTMTRDIWDECRMHDKDIVLREFGGLWGWVLTHKEPVLSNDPLHDPRHSRQPYGHIRIRTFLGVPCVWRGKVVGMVALANKKGGYTPEDRKLIIDYSHLVTLAILEHRHIMEKRKAEDALKRSHRLQESLLSIGLVLPRCDTISEAWEAAAGPIVETVGARAASLYLPDASGTHFRLAVGHGLSEAYIRKINEQRLPVTLKTVIGTAFLKKKPTSCGDIERDPKFQPYRDLVRGEGYRSVIAVPVIPEKTCMGVAVFYYASARRFLKEEINLVHLAVRQLTPSLARITYDRKMRESEERFRSLVENNLVGVYLIQEGIFRYVNPRLAWIFGYSQNELIEKKGPLDLTDPADRPLVEENLRKRVSGEVDAIHYWFRGIRKDNSPLDVEVFGSRVMHQGKPAVVGTLLDVTERKQAEEALKNAHDRLIIVLDSLDAVVYATDMATHEILFVNRYARDVFGDVVGKLCWQTLQTGQSGPCAFGSDKNLLAPDGRPTGTYTWEFQNTVNGRWYDIHDRAIPWVDGRLVRLEIATDITERKQMERVLQESEEKYRLIFKNSPIGILHFDRNGDCSACNDTFAEIMGAPMEKVLALNLKRGLTNERMKAAVGAALSGKMGRFEGEYTSVVGERTRILKADFAPIQSQDGSVSAGIGVFQDVTENKRLEEELSRAQRMEAAGRVAGQIAHDFNNLLSPLMAYPDLIRMECKDERVLPLVEQMQAVAIQMSEINQQLLTLGRRGHYAVEVIRLDRLLERLLASHTLPRTVVLEEDIAPDLMPIKGGAAQLNRAFSNLINNAREAMNDIGTLRITMRNVYLDRPLKGYETVQRGEYVRVEIGDTGCGIEKKIMHRIFEPFFSTKITDKKRGSGLGLSVVRAVIEDHNGYLGMESRSGEGAAFSFYFPISRETVSPEAPALSILSGGDERILVVDDDPIQREVLRRILEQVGYNVTFLESGEEAVSYVKDHPCDLLVLDMIMDGIDGTETYRRIREICPDQKAVILSGYAESDRVAEAQRMGAGAFIRKPVHMRELSDAIRRELDK